MSPLNVLDLGLLLRTAIPSDDKRLLTSSPLPPFLSRQKTYEQLFTLEGSYYGITSLVSPQDLIKRPSDVASGLGVFAQSVRGDKDFQAVIRKELRADPVLLDRRIFEKAAEHVQLSALSRRDQQLCLSHYLNYGFLSVYPPRTSKENISQQEATPDIEDLLKTLQPLHDLRLLVSDNMLLEGLSPQKIWPFVWALLIIQHQGTPALEDDPLFAGSIEKIAQAHEREGLRYSARSQRVFIDMSRHAQAALFSFIEPLEALTQQARSMWDGWQEGHHSPMVLVEELPSFLNSYEELLARLQKDFPSLTTVFDPIDVHHAATPFSPNTSGASIPKFPAVAAMLLEREIKFRSDILNKDKQDYERRIKNLPAHDPVGRMMRAKQDPVWAHLVCIMSFVEALFNRYQEKSLNDILGTCENVAQIVDDLENNSEEETINERMVALFYNRLRLDVCILFLDAEMTRPDHINNTRKKAAALWVRLSDEQRQLETTQKVTFTFPSPSVTARPSGSLFEKARRQMAEGLWGEAENSLRTLISISPTDPLSVWARFHVALIYQKCDQHEKAEALLRNLATHYPDIPDFPAYHGLSLEAHRDIHGEKEGATLEEIILAYIHSFERMQHTGLAFWESERDLEDNDPLGTLDRFTLKHFSDMHREETLDFLKQTLDYYRLLLPDLDKYPLLEKLERAAERIIPFSPPLFSLNPEIHQPSPRAIEGLLRERRFTRALILLRERRQQIRQETPLKTSLDISEIEFYLNTARSLFFNLNIKFNREDPRFIRDLGQFVAILETEAPHHFGINILLADIALSLEDQETARQRFRKALEVFPDSLYLRHMARL